MGFLPVEEQMQVIMRGVADLVSEDELRRKLTESLKTGRPLRVKLGIDPTGSDLTLGHTIPLRKLKAFQQLGHTAILLIGDYTAMVGDPTDRNEARPQLTHEQTMTNALTFVEQALKVGLDRDKLEIRYNGEWLGRLTFAETIKLCSQMTLARMMEREDFSRRYAEGRPISIHELLYPLMQGYDSVALQADVELGATEQKFNLLCGRDLQRDAGQEAQVCLMNDVIEGLDGKEKMSKSKGNYIGLNDHPNDMYGKTMSIPDTLITKYFIHFTDVSLAEIGSIAEQMQAGANPRDFKMRLGREIVRTYCGEEAALAAEEHFRTVFQRGELPDDIPAVTVAAGTYPLFKLLVDTGLAPSTSEARRLAQQGGVTVGGEKVTDPGAVIAVADGLILRAGKRKFARLVVG